MLYNIKNTECVTCNGFTEGCGDYTPNNKPGEESAYCSHYVNLRKIIKEMKSGDRVKTINEINRFADGLKKLLQEDPKSNKSQKHRPIELSDIRAITTA